MDAAAEEPEGFLRLMVSPRNARVFVDGVYEGTVDDFGGTGERMVRAGLHTVRVEADGFEPVEFDVRVPPTTPSRCAATSIPAACRRSRRCPRPARAARQAEDHLRIPRCYLGDSRPEQNPLPAGCSARGLLRTLD